MRPELLQTCRELIGKSASDVTGLPKWVDNQNSKPGKTVDPTMPKPPSNKDETDSTHDLFNNLGEPLVNDQVTGTGPGSPLR